MGLYMKLTKNNARAIQLLNSMKRENMQAVSGNAKSQMPWYDSDKKSSQRGKKSKAK